MLGATVGFEHLSLSVSLVAAFTNGLIYVLSLYIWNSKYKRSDPIVIKKKFLSVKLASIASILFVYLLSRPKSSGYRFHELIGLKIEGVFLSICVALLSTCILFSGPIVQNTTYNFIYYENKSESCRTFTKFFFFLNEQLRENFSWNSLRHVTWWRNYVVSPITEELVFRACLLPLVYNQLKFTNSILISPSFFGLAHLHHIFEGYRNGEQLKPLIKLHLFQFCYTYAFGIFSSFLFLRTGNLLACIVAHSFCNFMGFPDLDALFEDFPAKTRNILIGIYLLGLINFLMFIWVLTEPNIFNNTIYSN